jgi:predicted nucleic acid-binding protein
MKVTVEISEEDLKEILRITREKRKGAAIRQLAMEALAGRAQRDRARTEALMATVPVLPTPSELWSAARVLGQKCVDNGFLPPAIDLLIAQVCLHHDVPLITFDAHFQQIAEVSLLKVDLVKREE